MLRLKFFDWIEKVRFTKIGPWYRQTGKSLALAGIRLQGSTANDDRLVPSLRQKQFQNLIPDIESAQFIAPNSCIVGDVQLGDFTSIWYGSVIRGDKGKITTGKNVVIHDLSFLQSKDQKDILIGDNVYIGANSVIESCYIQNSAFIGMGATVKQGAKINANSVIAAGSVISENTEIKSYEIWAGNPAQFLRNITPQEKEALDEHHQEQIELSRVHAEETEKTFRQVLDDMDQDAENAFLDDEDLALNKLKDLGFPTEYDDEDYIEQRVFLKDQGKKDEDQFWKKSYDPYEQDLFNFPDSFKIYGENFEYYEKVQKQFEQQNYPNGGQSNVQHSQDAWNKKYDL